MNINVLIVGGGIAGLWLLNRLSQANYSAVLLESDALGAGQTICSQGIIHGGIKYALTGKLNAASQAIETMPRIWQNCLEGRGEIDLSAATILSHTQHMWSPGSLASDISAFLASKSLQSRVNKATDLPAPFDHESFNGAVYELNEIVLDIPSVLGTLAKPYLNNIIKYDPNQTHWGNNHVTLHEYNRTLHYDYVVCLAGKGNQAFLEKPAKQQLRPLHMSYLRMPGLPKVYAHCMQSSTKPRITITSHQDKHEVLWYLGGDLAETGVKRSPEEQNAFARQELNQLLPWMDFSKASIHSFLIDRAEEAQWLNRRPNAPCVQQDGNKILAWPTKLAFAPLLTEQIIKRMANITKVAFPTEIASLPKPAIALPPWSLP
jgi:glycine/D-amino acid oxidase-like deaminating enzyme